MTAASYVHAFWEVNPLWNIGAGEPGDDEGMAPVKTNLKGWIYCKRSFGIGSGNTNAILIFCLIWYWVVFLEGFTIGQLLDGVKRDFILHWSYDRIWRRLLRISWNYQWLSCIFRRLQEFWPWLGRLQGARWRTPTCLDGCCCLPSCQNQSWDKRQSNHYHTF